MSKQFRPSQSADRSSWPVRFPSLRGVAAIVLLALGSANAGRADSGAARIIEARDAQLTAFDVIEVAASQAGVLEEVSVAEGDVLAAGDFVARLNDDRVSMDAELARLELELAQFVAEDDIDVRHAQKAQAVAEAELHRSEAANKRIEGSVPQREVERLRLSAERAALAVEQAQRSQTQAREQVRLKELQVKIAEHELKQHQINAPGGGMVVNVNKRTGEWVEQGEAILEIEPVSRLRAEGFVAADDALVELRGARALFELVVGESETVRLRGRVTFVSPDANPLNQQVRVRAEFPAAELELRPGLAGTLKIERRKLKPVEDRSLNAGVRIGSTAP